MGSLLMLALVAAPVHLNAGTLTLELSSSELAQWFHIVDQLSGWSQFSHQQYRRALATDVGFPVDDEAALRAHALLRQRLGYGTLEQAFYAPRSLNQALAWLGKEGGLSAADVAIEERVMTRFEARVLPLLNAGRPELEAFVARATAAKAELAKVASTAQRFFGCGNVTLPAYLIASTPGATGGGANGGVLTIEVGKNADAVGTMLHESWHALGACKRAKLNEAASALGVDAETLSEGLAYAVAPGLWHQGEGDPLAAQVAHELERGRSFTEPLVRFTRLALAIRPTLSAALEAGKTLEQTLPLVAAAFVALRELDDVAHGLTVAVFCFGKPCTKALTHRIADAKRASIWGRDLVGDQVSELLPKIRPRDTVLLFPEGELPAEAQRLCGAGWARLEKKLRADAGLEQLTSPFAHVIVAWGPGAAERAAAALGVSLSETVDAGR